jgi:hypothetical protein
MNNQDTEQISLCLLCRSKENEFFFEDKFRAYRRCGNCFLVFVPESFHVSAESEKARYEEHNNDPEDIRYRQFLERITVPIIERFPEGAKGLDFGCGPTPLLSVILQESGFEMEVYDPIYAPDKGILKREYDFVVSTEVLEHLKRPLDEIEKLYAIVGSGGMLAIMTRPLDKTVDFRGWRYKNDRTHIAFFSVETFDWISARLNMAYKQVGHDIFVFDIRK